MTTIPIKVTPVYPPAFLDALASLAEGVLFRWLRDNAPSEIQHLCEDAEVLRHYRTDVLTNQAVDPLSTEMVTGCVADLIRITTQYGVEWNSTDWYSNGSGE